MREMSGKQRRSLVVTLALLAASATLARSRTLCRDDGGLEFDDVPSLTVLSSAVFDGRPVDGDSDDVVNFRVGQFYKGAELFPDEVKRSTSVRVAVRVSSSQCASLLRRRRRRRLLVFLNGSHTDSVSDDRRPVYWSTAAPVRSSKRSVKAVRRHSCSDCGGYDRVNVFAHLTSCRGAARRAASRSTRFVIKLSTVKPRKVYSNFGDIRIPS